MIHSSKIMQNQLKKIISFEFNDKSNIVHSIPFRRIKSVETINSWYFLYLSVHSRDCSACPSGHMSKLSRINLNKAHKMLIFFFLQISLAKSGTKSQIILTNQYAANHVMSELFRSFQLNNIHNPMLPYSNLYTENVLVLMTENRTEWLFQPFW